MRSWYTVGAAPAHLALSAGLLDMPVAQPWCEGMHQPYLLPCTPCPPALMIRAAAWWARPEPSETMPHWVTNRSRAFPSSKRVLRERSVRSGSRSQCGQPAPSRADSACFTPKQTTHRLCVSPLVIKRGQGGTHCLYCELLSPFLDL